jgi:tetratricopeptide (TPR) repeat protein
MASEVTVHSPAPDGGWAIAWEAYQAGRYAQAVTVLDALLASQPARADAWHVRGMALFQMGKAPTALHSLDQALHYSPRDAAMHSNRGLVLRALQGAEAALAAYNQALLLKPDFAQALSNRGNALRDLHRPAQALQDYQEALRWSPNYVHAMHGSGLALGDLGQWEQARMWLERAAATQPDFVTAYLDWGNALRELDRFDEALACYDRALALRATYAEAWSNRGVVLKQLGRLQEAHASYTQALQLKPDFADALVNCATLLKDMGHIDAALAMNQQALALDAQSAGAHLNAAICHLLQGNFAEGFEHYEWRWQTPQMQDGQRGFAQPLWLGQADIRGQTILLHAEQGLGDTLQFCRYAPLVAALGAHVVMEVQPALLRIVQGLPGVQQWVARGAVLPAFDWHCPLLSLPKAMGTQLHSIPAAPAYLQADAEMVQAWNHRLGPRSVARVGLVWSGRPEHKNDGNRSIPFSHMQAMLLPGMEVHCLQKEIRPSDVVALQSQPQVRVWADQLHDFSDTAALVQCMDWVISADTSVAHMAAALGKPVWMLVPFNPDWRWMVGRSDSQWYPSMRLFRQTRWGDWSETVEMVRQALQEELLARQVR